MLWSVAFPTLVMWAGCDSKAQSAGKEELASSKTETKQRADDKRDGDKRDGDKVDGDEREDDGRDSKDAPVEPKAGPAPEDGLDPDLDNSALDDTGKAIAKLFDASKTCSFDMNSQIRGCKPYDAFRAMERSTSPMTKEFADQRDRVAITRLKSKEATVRALSYKFGRNVYLDHPEERAAIESALSAESDTVALLVGLRAVRQQLRANPSLKPVFEKHAKSSVQDVAETAQKALDEAAK